jgi:hypothetical protein
MPFVTQIFTQNLARTLRLEVIGILSLSDYIKTNSKFQNQNKWPFSPPTNGLYNPINHGKLRKFQGKFFPHHLP